MKLSFQTVCIIFGVTLVHLIVIAAISPRGSEGMTLYGPAGFEASELETTEATPEPAAGVGEANQGAVPNSVEAAAPVDLPARRREDAALPSHPLSEPVAATRAPAIPPRS